MIEDSPVVFVVYATGIGLVLAAIHQLWSSSRPRRIDIDRGPSILKSLAIGALVLGVALSAVIFLALVVELMVLTGPTHR